MTSNRRKQNGAGQDDAANQKQSQSAPPTGLRKKTAPVKAARVSKANSLPGTSADSSALVEETLARIDEQNKIKAKDHKSKLIKDRFTLPEEEYQSLRELKQTCADNGMKLKKNDLLRLGVALLKEMEIGQIYESASELEILKYDRTKKSKI